MYAYQKRKIAKIFSVTIAIVIVSLLIIIPNFSSVSSSLSQVIPTGQSNLVSFTGQQSAIQGQQSPWGPKETQYFIDGLKNSPDYPNLLDCSDSQLLQILISYHNRFPYSTFRIDQSSHDLVGDGYDQQTHVGWLITFNDAHC